MKEKVVGTNIGAKNTKYSEYESCQYKKNKSNSFRKNLLSSNTIYMSFYPMIEQINQAGLTSCMNWSVQELFENFKYANRVAIKGMKVYESFCELRLTAILFPCTLFLTGPIEDIKVIKQAWKKRSLKSPKGFSIKEVGVVQNLTVEVIPQSPFLSLSTALFDAVADMNSKNTYPSKQLLHEYLGKHYPELSTPSQRVIHECLGRLINERKLYHNGRGYFILHDEHILNEVIAHDKHILNEVIAHDKHILNEVIAHDKHNLNEVIAHDKHILNEVIANKFPSFSYTKELPLLNSYIDDHQPQRLSPENLSLCSGKSKPLENSCRITRECSQKMISPQESSLPKTTLKTKCLSETFNKNMSKESKDTTNDTISNTKTNALPNHEVLSYGLKVETRDKLFLQRPKVQRSHSFSGYETDKSFNAVSFALVGHHVSELDEKSKFKRSNSFGKANCKIAKCEKRILNNGKSVDFQTMNSDPNLVFDSKSCESTRLDVLNHYNDLGSCLSLTTKLTAYTASDFFPPLKNESLAEELKNAKVVDNIEKIELHKSDKNNNSRSTEEDVTIVDISISSVTDSNSDKSSPPLNSEVKKMLLSPRSRRKIGGEPYESQYCSRALGKRGTTANPNNESNNPTDNDSRACKTQGYSVGRTRPRSKTCPEKKRTNQKERNSLLFEEKRSSLKLIGMV